MRIMFKDHAKDTVLNDFYKVKLHDDKAYAKMLKRVEQIKINMGSGYCLHADNFVSKK